MNRTIRAAVGALIVSAAALLLVGFLAGSTLAQSSREPVVSLEIAREGFAGRTGTRLNIDASGRFTERSFLNEQERAPERQGQLDPAALERLRGALAQQRVSELPASVGTPAPVNGVTVTLSVDGDSRQAFAPPTAQLDAGFAREAAARGSEQERRLFGAVGAVLEATGSRR